MKVLMSNETTVTGPGAPDRAQWQLPLPSTLPDNARLFQTLSIIQDNNTGTVHVELGRPRESAEWWGWYLAKVALAIACSRDVKTNRSDGNLIEAIRKEFSREVSREVKRRS